MFNYPLPVPRKTHYSELGVGPEAAADEISDAHTEMSSRLKKEETRAKRVIDRVHQKFPGLKGACDELKRLQTSDEKADPKALQTLRRQVARLEDEAVKFEPEFLQLRDLYTELKARQLQINDLGITQPENREAYNRNNPPLSLLQLVDCSPDWFYDNRTVLPLLRTDISDFLVAAGEDVSHPSDLTRRDFTGDFSLNKVLDRG